MIMSEKELDTISLKVTKKFNQAIEKFIILDSHMSKSDFIRDAIRDKLRLEAPQLLKEMLKEEADS